MVKIMIAGAGGAPSEGVIRSIQECPKNEEIVGIGSVPTDLMISNAIRCYQMPWAVEKTYKSSLLKVLYKEKPDFIYFANDIEILEASRIRKEILKTGVKIYMPSADVIEKCVHKNTSAEIWQKEGIKVPKTMLIKNEQDLKKAFKELGGNKGKIWLRMIVGGGGKGSAPINNYDFARLWIERFHGWGQFTAAQMLKENSVTWLAIYYEGELVVGQTRKRRCWQFGNRTISGITGITGAGETYSDDTVTKVATDAILSIDPKPHGIYGVDMTYDFDDYPNPTEINIARFFTTVYFFTRAGLNMPKIYKDIALYNEFPSLNKKINPLKDGLLWVRGMDRPPRLTSDKEISKTINMASDL